MILGQLRGRRPHDRASLREQNLSANMLHGRQAAANPKFTRPSLTQCRHAKVNMWMSTREHSYVGGDENETSHPNIHVNQSTKKVIKISMQQTHIFRAISEMKHILLLKSRNETSHPNMHVNTERYQGICPTGSIKNVEEKDSKAIQTQQESILHICCHLPCLLPKSGFCCCLLSIARS